MFYCTTNLSNGLVSGCRLQIKLQPKAEPKTELMSKMSENRYQRQSQVAQLGPDAQEKLANAHVLIVGAGGLGSPVSLYLAGAGIGKITLVDPDHVSLSNLHRQILFTESDLGEDKATVGKARLTQLNSDIEIESVAEAITPKNVDHFVSSATVVVDAADAPDYRKAIRNHRKSTGDSQPRLK